VQIDLATASAALIPWVSRQMLKISLATQIDGFDGTGGADPFPSKAKQVTTYQWILIIFLVVPPWTVLSSNDARIAAWSEPCPGRT
jgi:hypothetical protein